MKRRSPEVPSLGVSPYVFITLVAMTMLGLAALAVANTYALRVRWGSGEVDMRPASAVGTPSDMKAGDTSH